MSTHQGVVRLTWLASTVFTSLTKSRTLDKLALYLAWHQFQFNHSTKVEPEYRWTSDDEETFARARLMYCKELGIDAVIADRYTSQHQAAYLRSYELLSEIIRALTNGPNWEFSGWQAALVKLPAYEYWNPAPRFVELAARRVAGFEPLAGLISHCATELRFVEIPKMKRKDGQPRWLGIQRTIALTLVEKERFVSQQHLASRFQVSQSTISKVFNEKNPKYPEDLKEVQMWAAKKTITKQTRKPSTVRQSDWVNPTPPPLTPDQLHDALASLGKEVEANGGDVGELTRQLADSGNAAEILSVISNTSI